MDFCRKIEIELRRKAEEEIHKNDIFLSKVSFIQKQLSKINNQMKYLFIQEEIEKAAIAEAKFREQMEQERRDHELALRLAKETNSFVEDISNTYTK